MRTLRRKSKNITNQYWDYDTITFQLYFDIAATGEVIKLQKTGHINPIGCIEAWDNIIKRNCASNKSTAYSTTLNNSKVYGSLGTDYVMIKAMLTSLSIAWLNLESIVLNGGKIEDGVIELYYPEYLKFLRKKGYKIDTDTLENYYISIQSGLHRSDNLITKMVSKQKESLMQKEIIKGKGETSCIQLIVNLNCLLGFTVPSNITLAEYNAYKEFLRLKESAAKKANKKK